jgi:hypothetical protein
MKPFNFALSATAGLLAALITSIPVLGDDGSGAHEPAAAWHLRIEGPMATTGGAQKTKPSKQYDASIDVSTGDNPLGAQIEQLMDCAWDKDEQGKKLDRAVEHYRTSSQRAVAQSKDTADYIVPFRGNGPSSEAGDVILGEKVKLKSRASSEYARQKRVDDIHLRIAADVIQISMGLGMLDPENSRPMIDAGMTSLKELVGDDQAERTLSMLTNWGQNVRIPETVFTQPVWDVTSKQAKVQQIVAEAVKADPVLEEITKRVHKYNQHSKLGRASSHVIQTTLGVASLTPDFIGPAAKAALVAYVMSTGGPEQCKLLKELYLDKRFDSRWKVLNEQAHMAVENYEVGLLTHNPVLLASTESLVEHMAGRSTVKKVFGRSLVTSGLVQATPAL